MKILQLCNKPPRPSVDGGCLAMDALTQGFLKAGHDVKVLAISTPKHKFYPDRISKEYLEKTRFESIFIDTSVNVIDAFSNLLTQDSYNISRFFSPDYDMRLKRLLQREKFDIIQFESLFMTPYLSTAKRHSKAKCVLRSHNLEYLIWKRIADGTKNRAKKFYLKHLAKKLETFELDVIKRVNSIVTISKDDYKKYAELKKSEDHLINIPFGINISEYDMANDPGEFSLFHIGSLEWAPNLEGVTWFLEEIWPEINKALPHFKFYLAGRDIPAEFYNKYPNLEVVGEVKDAKEFISSKALMLVPVLSAGGMRVKIIEGLALGKVIMSTGIGAEGIDYKKNSDIYIAETAKDFIKIISEFKSKPNTLNEQMLSSRKFVEENFNNEQLIIKLIKFYTKLID